MSSFLYISKSAIKHNIAQVKKYSNSKIVAVVKSNAYGHGLKFIIPLLKKADMFAVANIEEAIIAKSITDKPIVILTDFYQESDLKVIAENNFQVVINSYYQLKWLIRTNKKLNIWLKLDTNMHRLGLSLSEFDTASELLIGINNINIVAIMSHLHSADTDTKKTIEQVDMLVSSARKNNKSFQTSIANSAAIIKVKKSHLNYIRPGIMLYGISPFGEYDKFLKPVMTFVAKVIAIKKLLSGDKVGYGHSWTAKKNTLVAVINVGYSNGYPRSAKVGTPILINNKKCSLIARVSMNLICINTHNYKVSIGDDAILWGRGLPAEDVAKYSNTIAYELLTRVKGVKYKLIE